MAVSKTSFAERMNKINSGETTAWTVPGEGLATARDERSFLRKSGIKQKVRSTQKRRNPLVYLAALLAGAASVIAARWLEYTYAGQVTELVSSYGVDLASITAQVPLALVIAAALSTLAMLFLGVRGKSGLAVQATGFMAALLFEPDLVSLAPDIYAYLYPPDWISSMMAKASLLA